MPNWRTTALFPLGGLFQIDGLSVEEVIIRARAVTLVITATSDSGECPRCKHRSWRVHGRYTRTLHDLPWADMAVTLRLRVRRFRCTSPSCSQVIFAERFPNLARVRARRTDRQKAALEYVGFALGGAAGARLAGRMRLSGSRPTILRLVYAAPMPPTETPRVLGVDDWAKRKGQRYGTILVDLEKHHPIDLLTDRTAEGLASWLRDHPGVEIISRDRGGSYADGGRQGAPDAIQVADRFHLLTNIGEVVDRLLSRKHACLRDAALALDRIASETSASGEDATASATTAAAAPPPSEQLTKYKLLKKVRRDRRVEHYEAVKALYEQGASSRAISRQVGLSRTTVRRFMRAETFPERAVRPKRATILNTHELYLRERWTAGVHNAYVLWREIRERGFTGSASLVRRFVAAWRDGPGRRGPTSRRASTERSSPTPPAPQPTKVRSPRQARWLLLRKDDDLEEEDVAYRDQLIETSEEIRAAKRLADDFGRIVKERDPPGLHVWMETAEGSGLPEFRGFALMLRRDLPAVKAALTHNWSNGQTEGQINRLKSLKRQMYGRASMDLLKRRFIKAA
jgi:transposase